MKKVKLFDFPETELDVQNYEHLGYVVDIDDETNKIYVAEREIEAEDSVAILSELEGASEFNLRPYVDIDGQILSYEDGYKYVDENSWGIEYEFNDEI